MTTCAVCGAPDPIRGDGEKRLVCPRCVTALGRVAGDPFSVPVTVRAQLLEKHIGVVDLDAGRWTWTPSWPGTRDGRLVRGGVA
jgi:hypothetical protein